MVTCGRELLVHGEWGGLIEDEFQAKCVKGALNGFGVIQRCS